MCPLGACLQGKPNMAAPGTMAPKGHYVENPPMNLLQGQDATCPHCWETINLTLDLSVPEQSYVEDCPVCCKPMLVSYTSVDGEIAEFNVEPAE
jgi:Cysteine-rich CPXCG